MSDEGDKYESKSAFRHESAERLHWPLTNLYGLPGSWAWRCAVRDHGSWSVERLRPTQVYVSTNRTITRREDESFVLETRISAPVPRYPGLTEPILAVRLHSPTTLNGDHVAEVLMDPTFRRSVVDGQLWRGITTTSTGGRSVGARQVKLRRSLDAEDQSCRLSHESSTLKSDLGGGVQLERGRWTTRASPVLNRVAGVAPRVFL